MKTYRQHFETLKKRPRELAIRNCRAAVIDTPVDSLPEALISGFIWEKTWQGHDYWNNLYKKLTQ
jgi:hypothetical protein